MLLETLWQDVCYGARMLWQKPSLQRHRHPHARARHRRQHGDLQRGQRRAARAAAVRRAGSRDRARPADHAKPRRAVAVFLPQLRRLSRSEPVVRAPRGLLQPQPDAHRRSRSAAAARHGDHGRPVPLLGVQPVLGRTFLPEEDAAGGGPGGRPGDPELRMWQEQFGGDAGIVGRAVDLNNSRFTIVGVMPAGFRFPIQPQPTRGVDLDRTRQRAAGGPGRDHGGARLSRLARDRAAEAGRDASNRRSRRPT